MRFETTDGPTEIPIRNVVVAGWTGRDRAGVDHHIAELAAIGVAPPSQVPLYYRVSELLLTQSVTIQVLGFDTSGEAEPLIVRYGDTLWLGLASDHTDRSLETVSVAASKQICPKPVARQIWPLEDVKDHLDQLVLTCDIEDDGRWQRYQEGALSKILPLEDLVAGAGLTDGSAMLCGTLSAIGGVRPAARYRMALTDPVRGREIDLSYDVDPLPLVD